MKRVVDSGVKWCIINDFTSLGLVYHRYLAWGNTRTEIIGGVCHYLERTYTIDSPDPCSGNPGAANNSCTPIKLNPCRYDVKKFKKCVQKWPTGNQRNSEFNTSCIGIARMIVNKCKKGQEDSRL